MSDIEYGMGGPDFNVWSARGREMIEAAFRIDRERTEKLAADIFNAAFSDMDCSAVAALAVPWPDLTDFEQACPDLEATKFAPSTPRGAPDVSFVELSMRLRISEWGAHTALHIEALERAVRRADALVWPSF